MKTKEWKIMEKQASKAIIPQSLFKRRKKYNLRPDYQRGLVWGKKEKQLLIDTMLRDMYVPEILFRKIENEPGVDFDVLDGQQRISTIFHFMEDGFRTPKGLVINGQELGGLLYSQLPDEWKNQFESFQLSYVTILGNDDEIEEMFRRLQRGIPLKDVEERNSIKGLVRDFVRNSVNHVFWTETCGVNEKNNNHLQYNKLIEQLLVLEDKGIVDIKRKDLDSLFNEHNTEGYPEEKKIKFLKIMDYVYNAFRNDQDRSYFKPSTIQGLYLLLSDYINEDENKEHYKDFEAWFVTFENERKAVKDLPEKKQNKDLVAYNQAMIGGTNASQSLQIRKDILEKSWKTWLENKKK